MKWKSALLMLLLCGCVFGELPPVPFTVWDLDFENETVGAPPRKLTADEIEKAGAEPWAQLPVKTISGMDFITAEKFAVIEEAPNGFRSKALTLQFQTTAQPHWGPRVYVQVPEVVRKNAELLKLTWEMSKSNRSRVAGMQLQPVLEILHYENGENKVNARSTLSRYAAGTPSRYELLLNCRTREFEVRAVGADSEPVRGKWNNPAVEAPQVLMFSGLFPGGNVGSTGSLSVDNIRLTVEKWKSQQPGGEEGK